MPAKQALYLLSHLSSHLSSSTSYPFNTHRSSLLHCSPLRATYGHKIMMCSNDLSVHISYTHRHGVSHVHFSEQALAEQEKTLEAGGMSFPPLAHRARPETILIPAWEQAYVETQPWYGTVGIQGQNAGSI